MLDVSAKMELLYSDSDDAKKSQKLLKKDLEKSCPSIFSDIELIPYDISFDEYKASHVQITKISKTKSIVEVCAQTGEFGVVLKSKEKLLSTGASHIHISEVNEDGIGKESFYDIEGPISNKTYYSRLQGIRECELQDIYLPDERCNVIVTLKRYKWEPNKNAPVCQMFFETSDGHEFMYRGNNELTKLTQDSYSKTCEFSASFRLLKLGKKLYSTAVSIKNIQINRVKIKYLADLQLTNENEVFYNGPLKEVIRKYIDAYSMNIEKLIESIEQNSIMGLEYGYLLDRLKKGDEYQFEAFSLSIDAKASLSSKTILIRSCNLDKKLTSSYLIEKIINKGIEFSEQSISKFEIEVKCFSRGITWEVQLSKYCFQINIRI